jgi:hypothetical protein
MKATQLLALAVLALCSQSSATGEDARHTLTGALKRLEEGNISHAQYWLAMANYDDRNIMYTELRRNPIESEAGILAAAMLHTYIGEPADELPAGIERMLVWYKNSLTGAPIAGSEENFFAQKRDLIRRLGRIEPGHSWQISPFWVERLTRVIDEAQAQRRGEEGLVELQRRW